MFDDAMLEGMYIKVSKVQQNPTMYVYEVYDASVVTDDGVGPPPTETAFQGGADVIYRIHLTTSDPNLRRLAISPPRSLPYAGNRGISLLPGRDNEAEVLFQGIHRHALPSTTGPRADLHLYCRAHKVLKITDVCNKLPPTGNINKTTIRPPALLRA